MKLIENVFFLLIIKLYSKKETACLTIKCKDF